MCPGGCRLNELVGNQEAKDHERKARAPNAIGASVHNILVVTIPGRTRLAYFRSMSLKLLSLLPLQPFLVQHLKCIDGFEH